MNRLQRLLSELLPGQAKPNPTALQAKEILASRRPRDLDNNTRKRMVVEPVEDLVVVDARIKALNKELKAMVLATGRT